MAMTVITISNAPPSLRGDLTKWMQEISTGVYIGNLSARVREELWKRVNQSIGKGQATISYAFRNELGYQFDTFQTKQVNVCYDGIPLVMIPTDIPLSQKVIKTGFSNQAKYREAKKFINRKKKTSINKPYVVLDIETTGLNPKKDTIIEIAAIKIKGDNMVELHYLLKNEKPLPENIIKLTGITSEILISEGQEISKVMDVFLEFIGNLPIVGYNIAFDMRFINSCLSKLNKPALSNRLIDLLNLVKKEKMFLNSYKLQDVLLAYDIKATVVHRALDDTKLTYLLSTKVNEFKKILNKER